MKKWLIAAGLVAIGTLALFQGRAAATPPCRKVKLTITTTVDPQNCQSPVGMCTSGKIYRGNSLWATTHYVASALGATALASDMSYAGTLTVTRPNGTLVIRDSGLLSFTDDLFTEYQRIVSGTGVFAGTTGTLFSSGNVTGELEGFAGTLTGEICLGNKHGNHGLGDDDDD